VLATLLYFDGFRLEEFTLKAYFEIFLDVNDKQTYLFLEGPENWKVMKTNEKKRK
jgi:hypothetical protein